jgi:hypothetical protein
MEEFARDATAVTADFAVAEIVGQDEEDVRFVRGLCRCRSEESHCTNEQDFLVCGFHAFDLFALRW